MDVYRLSGEGIECRAVEELPSLIAREDGFVWVDVPTCDEQAGQVLTQVFCAHPLAVRECFEHSHVPKVHTYADHIFVTPHAPELGEAGRDGYAPTNPTHAHGMV